MKNDFGKELKGLPPEVVAELEDHLASTYEAHVAAGRGEEDARRRTLAEFGDLRLVARQMTGMAVNPIWGRRRVPKAVRWGVAGWLGFGLACLGRLCTHGDPTYVTVGTCLLVGMTGCGLAMGLLRLRESMRRWMVGYLMAVGVVMVVSAATSGSVLPIAAGWFPVLSMAAVGSAWVLTRRSIRQSFL